MVSGRGNAWGNERGIGNGRMRGGTHGYHVGGRGYVRAWSAATGRVEGGACGRGMVGDLVGREGGDAVPLRRVVYGVPSGEGVAVELAVGVVSVVVAEVGTGCGATAREISAVQPRDKPVKRGGQVGIGLRRQPKLVKLAGLERLHQTLDLCRLQLVPAVGLGDVSEAVQIGEERRGRRPEGKTGV